MIPLYAFLPPVYLDALLSRGWYRMRQHVFTTNEIWLSETLRVPVWWARIRLEGFVPNHRHKKIMRLCRRFSTTLHNAVITPEIEALYAAYSEKIDFDGSASVSSFLMDDRGVNFFPARMWQMRDGDRLIAVGYFDEGEEASAGILNFYHPDYRKYSPGLWLYFESIRYAAEQGKRFFYPGYIAIGYPKFDYKLLAGTEKMEMWDAEHTVWVPYAASEHALLSSISLPA